METKLQKLEVDLPTALSGVFTNVPQSGILPGYILELEGKLFGCDDYGLLFRTLFEDREDIMLLFTNAEKLRQYKGMRSLSNIEIANLIEAVAIVNEESNTMTKVVLEGFWITIPSPVAE